MQEVCEANMRHLGGLFAVEHRIQCGPAQEEWNKMHKKSFTLAAADARVTGRDETGRCTSGGTNPCL